MAWLSSVGVQVAGGLVVLAIGWAGGTLTNKWRERRRAAQWTLEHVTGEEWTLRRDSPKTAFNVHVWNEGDGVSAGTVKLAYPRERFDVPHGELVDVVGVHPGVEVIVDWVEGGRRLATRTRVRESTQQVEVLLKDAIRYA